MTKMAWIRVLVDILTVFINVWAKGWVNSRLFALLLVKQWWKESLIHFSNSSGALHLLIDISSLFFTPRAETRTV
jgi:hypothetical protein